MCFMTCSGYADQSLRDLLSKGVDVDTRDTGGKTALHCAATFDQEAMAEGATVVALIEHGADVNARSKSGTTPLHEAARAGNATVVTILLKHGADPLARDDCGMTPERCAKDSNHRAVAELLRAASERQARRRSHNTRS